MIYTKEWIICPQGLGIREKLGAWHILGCSAISEHSTEHMKEDEVHLLRHLHTKWSDMNFKPKHTLIQIQTFFIIIQTLFLNHLWMRNEGDESQCVGVQRMKKVGSAVSSSSQASCHGIWGGVGRSVCGRGWGQRIVTTSWGQSMETGTRTANQNITSAAPAHRQSHRAVKRRQCQSDSPQLKKGNQPIPFTPII